MKTIFFVVAATRNARDVYTRGTTMATVCLLVTRWVRLAANDVYGNAIVTCVCVCRGTGGNDARL